MLQKKSIAMHIFCNVTIFAVVAKSFFQGALG